MEAAPLAERQCAEVPIDCGKQLLSPRQSKRHMANVEVLHVMTALQVLPHIAFTCMRQGQTLTDSLHMDGTRSWQASLPHMAASPLPMTAPGP